MQDEACRSFRDGSAGGRCTGVDGVPPVSPLSTGQAPQCQGRFTERAQLNDGTRLMGPSSKQLRIPATTGTTETTLQHTKPRDEILSAPAPHTAPCNETFTAPARHKQPEFTHFHHAGANFLSQHTPCTHHTPTPGRHFFQPTGAQHCEPTGTNRKELSATSPRQWGNPPPEKSHVIRLDEVSTKSENVAIPTI